MPPRLSTGSVVSLTWARDEAGSASTSATTASGSVTRKTEPHQKCSSSAPESSGPSEAMRAAEPRPERDRLRPRRPRPERRDQGERRRVGHAGREAAEEARHEQHLVGRRVGGEQAGGDRQAPCRGPASACARSGRRARRGRAPTRRGRASSRRRSGSSVVWTESNALPMAGRATLATARFRLATAATRISETRTRPARSGAVEAAATSATAGASQSGHATELAHNG